MHRQDRTRHLEAHHYCTHLTHEFHQCIIYDSDQPNAKLIGIEYIVSEKVSTVQLADARADRTKQIFDSLPAEEKRYWHSHKYEVESGYLQMQANSLVPGAWLQVIRRNAFAEADGFIQAP